MIGARTSDVAPRGASSSARAPSLTRTTSTEEASSPLGPWSTRMLHDLLVATGVPRDADDAAMLASARLPNHKLGATLLSLREREGRLGAAESAELERYRVRAAFYADLWDRLRSTVPGMVVIKGADIARLYPTGALRAAADLDLHCTRRQLWAAAKFLASDGWRLASLSVARSARGIEIYVVFKKPPRILEAEAEAGVAPYEVELKTLEFANGLGNLARFAPLSSSIVRSVLAILAERSEQRFRSRDLLDLTLLLHHADRHELASLARRLDSAELWPAWWEARRRLLRLGWCPPAAAKLAATPRGSALRVPGLATLGELPGWLHPARAAASLLRRTADSDYGDWADRMSTIFHERGGAARALAAGMTLYGVALDDECTDDLEIVPRGPHVVAGTPLGSFLMVCGAAREEWLAQARAIDER